MSRQSTRFRPGDIVEVRSPDEILSTLDAEGASDHLPFMPEMVGFCGQRFQVSKRAGAICFSGPGSPRGFKANDVVTLNGVRCSGAAHDGCQKECMIFWREGWLRKVDDAVALPMLDLEGAERLRGHLKVLSAPKTYYCQASELSKSTDPMSQWKRLGRMFSGLRAGNFSATRLAHDLTTWLFWKIRRKLLGPYPRGRSQSTPTESLNLQPSEWVEVKPLRSIAETLNGNSQNRGLYFSPDMRLSCGRRYRVKSRLDKIIVDGTGELRQLRNTVCLEGSTCGCAYMGWGLGGCSRCEFTYWREIWLRRLDERSDGPAAQT